ncbi:MAG: hypothetical protein Q4A83_00205 [Bacillota bacterium]|nr:hypothetical protein [Bacillota bacterium]
MKKFVAILLILVMVFALSSVAFAATDVVSPEGTDGEHDEPSPQTGDLANIYWIVIAAVLAVGVAFFCGKKLIAEK